MKKSFSCFRHFPFSRFVIACLALFLLGMDSPVTAQECFSSAPSLLSGQHPISVAVADFNHDGRLDFVAADPPLQGISVLLGNGDASFQPASKTLVGFQPWYVAIGDFNSDGNPDVAVADYTYCVASVIYILLGNGDGTFQPPVSYKVDKTPVSISVVDLNGDGVQDLVVVNTVCSDKISVLLGNGDGTFQTRVNYYVPAMVAATVGDFNEDGKVDLAAIGGDGNLWILNGHGDGTFQIGTGLAVEPANVIPTSIARGDLNRDGHADLIITNIYGGAFNLGTADVLLGNGNGTFQAAASYNAGENSEFSALADFNNDGVPDLAIATLNTNSANILLGNGDGSFRYGGAFTTGDGSMSVAAGDFDNDGALDLVVANNGIGTTFNSNLSPGNVSLLLGHGDGTFQSGTNTISGRKPTASASADFNHDGKADLAVADFNGALNILLGNGDGTFTPGANYRAGDNLSYVVAADFNHDGKIDLATADFHRAGVSVLFGNGDGTFQHAVLYRAGAFPRSLALGDFNGDGNIDLAVANEVLGSPGTVSILLGNFDGTFQAPLAFAAGFRPKSVAAGDFNGDGKLDLAVANYISHNVSILLGNGDGSFQPPVDYIAGKGPRSLAVGDFNGDGKLDLAVAATNTSHIVVLLGNGDGTFQKGVRYAAGHGPNFVAVADVNHDGKPDLIVPVSYTASHGNGSLAVLLGIGDGSFQPPAYYGVALLPRSATVADFNGDGQPDLAVTNFTSNSVTVLLNSSAGGFKKGNHRRTK